jgi:hypothetical protein
MNTFLEKNNKNANLIKGSNHHFKNMFVNF